MDTHIDPIHETRIQILKCFQNATREKLHAREVMAEDIDGVRSKTFRIFSNRHNGDLMKIKIICSGGFISCKVLQANGWSQLPINNTNRPFLHEMASIAKELSEKTGGKGYVLHK